MRLYLRLAWRNIWRHKRRTIIVAAAIGLGMAMMMMYDGLIDGFDEAIYGNAIRVLGGNIQVHAGGYSEQADSNPLLPMSGEQAVIDAALAQPQVEAASRRVSTGGLATSREGAFSVGIVGIEPEKEQAVSLPAQNVTAGRYLTAEDQDTVLIGKGLADAMGLKVGDRFTLAGRAAHEQMRQRTMTVAGIFDLGMAEIEKRSVYMSLREAQDLYGLGDQSTEVMVTLKQMGDENKVIDALQPSLNGLETSSWETSFPELQAALETKGGVMNIFSVIIIVIAGIGILNLLLMAVYERTREIGLLGALGVKPRQISLLFLLEGAMMGLVGLVAGIIMGLLFNLLLGQIGIDFGKYASLTEYMALISGKIYPSLGIDKLLQRGITVLIISVLAAFIPAREAAQSEPAEALHFV
jgi:ABC-type lipoprotein release transport system permease subunit